MDEEGMRQGLLSDQDEKQKLISNNICASQSIDFVKAKAEGPHEYEDDDQNNRRRSSSAHESIISEQTEHEALLQKVMAANEQGTEVVKLSFNDIRYQVTVHASREEQAGGAQPTRKLEVLKGCTGYCLPGQLTFIMGASGAGKTSLLNRLSDRIATKAGDSLTGTVTFNDKHQLDGGLFGSYASYVMQDDVVFAYFTVKEALTFAARLKLTVPEAEQDERINQLIIDLGLQDCQNTLVGSIAKKLISGGERKRTAIGVELITDPKVILLDEPTSGLDSHTAVKIVATLQKLARKGNKTIVSTIHQPSSKAFSFCDRLILLADGYVVYQGPAKETYNYFNMASVGTKNQNPCDFFMRELSINYPKKPQDVEKIEKYLDKYAKEQADKVQEEMKRFQFRPLDTKSSDNDDLPYCKQLGLLYNRSKIFVSREPQAVFAKIGQAVFSGLLIMMLYWQIGGVYTLTGIQNQAGANFFMLVGTFMNWLFGSILTFQLEREVFLREQANKMYYPSAYFISKNLVELPAILLAPLAQMLVMYWAIDYNRFFVMYLVLVMTANTSMGIGLLISSMTPNMTAATSIAPLFTMPMILFGGFIANADSIPAWLGWVQYISPIRYGNEAIAHTQFDGVNDSNVIYYMDLQGFTIGLWKCVLCLVGLAVFWRILSLVVLKLQISKFQ